MRTTQQICWANFARVLIWRRSGDGKERGIKKPRTQVSSGGSSSRGVSSDRCSSSCDRSVGSSSGGLIFGVLRRLVRGDLRAVVLRRAGFRVAVFRAAVRRVGVLRTVVFRAAVRRVAGLRVAVFRAAVLRAGALRAAVFRTVVRRAAVFRAPVFRRVAVLRAAVLRAVVFRAAVLRAGALRAVPLRAAVLRAAVLPGLPGGRPLGMMILVRWSA